MQEITNYSLKLTVKKIAKWGYKIKICIDCYRPSAYNKKFADFLEFLDLKVKIRFWLEIDLKVRFF